MSQVIQIWDAFLYENSNPTVVVVRDVVAHEFREGVCLLTKADKSVVAVMLANHRRVDLVPA
jgi:hypothetical protein